MNEVRMGRDSSSVQRLAGAMLLLFLSGTIGAKPATAPVASHAAPV